MSDPRRSLPGVDRLLDSSDFGPLLEAYPRASVVSATREVLERARVEIGPGGREGAPEEPGEYALRVGEVLRVRSRPSLRSVINATGVIIHTNLGRAPLSTATREAMARAGEGYSNLEFDLEEGERGSRYVHCVGLLRELTGAEDALVVNNNAAAVVLALNTMALHRHVLVSRGELVEIGGGFRIPDMVDRSGARLREVGTTNRTRLSDYGEAAEEADVAAILKVHRSNFRISGFTEDTSVSDLAALAAERDLFLIHDLGSGLLADPVALGVPPEPRAPESLAQGAHVVAISGDKLLGGPQAGILLGSAGTIGRIRKNPLTRAFRVDKVTLAGLEATLRHYLDPQAALGEIPVLRMLAESAENLEARSREVARNLNSPGGLKVEVTRGDAVIGGGTYPGVTVPGWVLRIRGDDLSARALASRLRQGAPPVVGRVEDEELVLNLRTVDPGSESVLIAAILAAIRSGPEGPGSS